ncbi:MAG: hypothetical protein ACFFDV_09360 [Candidatus Thorarchaeota archaeon]
MTFENGLSAGVGILVFPIGNWTLVQELNNATEYHTIVGDVLKNATYFEDDIVWGFRFNFTTLRYYEYEPNVSLDCDVTVTEIFSKSDGVCIIEQVTTEFFSPYYPKHDFGTIVRTTAQIEDIPTESSYNLVLIGVGFSATIAIALMAIYWLKIRRQS